MRVHQFLLLTFILSLTACAGSRVAGDKASQTEYVEISNPGFTMTRDAPATIWVPKSSVENGPPRGSEAIKMAYESVKNSQSTAATPQSTPPPAAAATVAAQPASTGMRARVVVLETGHNQLAIPFNEKLRSLPGSPVIAIAPEAAADKLLSRSERAAYAVKAWQDSGATVSLFVSAPDGLIPGRHLSAELYDGMGAGLISKVDALITDYDPKGTAVLSPVVAAAISQLAERSRDAIALLPWYAKIVAIEGGRIYLNAGHEAGINMGQRLKVYRGGKVVEGLGFAPGTVIGIVEVNGFVGSNGSIAAAKDGVQVYPTDIVSLQ